MPKEVLIGIYWLARQVERVGIEEAVGVEGRHDFVAPGFAELAACTFCC